MPSARPLPPLLAHLLALLALRSFPVPFRSHFSPLAPLPFPFSLLRRPLLLLNQSNHEPPSSRRLQPGPSSTQQPRLSRPPRSPVRPQPTAPFLTRLLLSARGFQFTPAPPKIRPSCLSAARPPLGVGLPRDSSPLHPPPIPTPAEPTAPHRSPAATPHPLQGERQPPASPPHPFPSHRSLLSALSSPPEGSPAHPQPPNHPSPLPRPQSPPLPDPSHSSALSPLPFFITPQPHQKPTPNHLKSFLETELVTCDWTCYT